MLKGDLRMESKKPKLMEGGHTDEIYTPKYALDILLPFIRGDWTRVWECACGTGKLAGYLEEEEFRVIEGNDFLNEEFDCDIIITNPPYSIKDKFLERAFKLGKPFAFLLPISALGGEKRIRLFMKYGLQMIIPTKRVNYITPNNGKSSWFHTAWFCGNMKLPKQLNFVEINRD